MYFMSKVDILLATYNGAQFLTEQLDSILNQSFKDFRLIISDDNSTDNTRKILELTLRKGRIYGIHSSTCSYSIQSSGRLCEDSRFGKPR